MQYEERLRSLNAEADKAHRQARAEWEATEASAVQRAVDRVQATHHAALQGLQEQLQAYRARLAEQPRSTLDTGRVAQLEQVRE